MRNQERSQFRRRLSDFGLSKPRGETKPSSIEQHKMTDIYFFKKKFQNPVPLQKVSQANKSGVPSFLFLRKAEDPTKRTKARLNVSSTVQQRSPLIEDQKLKLSRNENRSISLLNSFSQRRRPAIKSKIGFACENVKPEGSLPRKRTQSYQAHSTWRRDLDRTVAKIPVSPEMKKDASTSKPLGQKPSLEHLHPKDNRTIGDLRTLFTGAMKRGLNPPYRDRGVQASPLVPSARVISSLKELARMTVRRGSKKEFDINEVFRFLQAKRSSFPEADFETQKLVKIFIDTYQRQMIFDEILKVLEDEHLDIEDELKQAYKNTLSQPLKSPNPNKELSQSLELDLSPLVHGREPGQTPKGFHQEFMALAPEFSLSWRQLCDKEQSKFKARAD